MSKMSKQHVALILAAGEGVRAQNPQAKTPKAYRLVAGPQGLAPMLRHSVQMLLAHARVDAVRCVIDPAHRLLYQQACEGLDGALLAPVEGGASRYHSAWRGLKSLSRTKPRVVLIHDAARPFAPPACVDACCEALAQGHDGALIALPMVDALKRVQRGRVIGQLDEADVWRAQTPQAFRYDKLLAAYEKLGERPAPLPRDDSEVAQRAGLAVACVGGGSQNEKLTFAEDFARAQPPPLRPLRRIGLGFDSHAFVQDGTDGAEGDTSEKPAAKLPTAGAGETVWLGGARIASPWRLKAHSDGDVVLHALCDALYGALADGDIGVHFPPGRAENRHRASSDFLRHALARMQARRQHLQQIDMVLLADAPKLAPHRRAIVGSLRRLLAACDAPLAEEQIGFKATTTEGLGVSARRGIAAWVMVGIA